MNEEQVNDQRAHIVRGVVLAVDDTGPLQTVDVKTHDGVHRTEIEVLLPWGLISNPPPGAIAVVAAIGADPADMMALGVAHPGARAGGSAGGSIGLADNGGNRVIITPGGQIGIVSATQITLSVGPTTMTITAAGVAITGNVSVTGNITATGSITHG